MGCRGRESEKTGRRKSGKKTEHDGLWGRREGERSVNIEMKRKIKEIKKTWWTEEEAGNRRSDKRKRDVGCEGRESVGGRTATGEARGKNVE